MVDVTPTPAGAPTAVAVTPTASPVDPAAPSSAARADLANVTDAVFAAKLDAVIAEAGVAIDVTAHGVTCDGRYVDGAADGGEGITMVAGSRSARVELGLFTADDVGKTLIVESAGYSTTISAYVDELTITLATPAPQEITEAAYFYGTDNTGPLATLVSTVTGFGPLRRLIFPQGVCVTDTITVRPNMVFEGSGPGGWANNSPQQQNYATTLKARANLTGNALAEPGAYFFCNVTFRDIALDGSAGVQSAAKDGIRQPDSPVAQDPKWLFDNIYVFNTSGDGLYVGTYQRAARLINCSFWECEGNGARLEATDNQVYGCVFGFNALHGLRLGGGVQHVTSNDTFNNGRAGVWIDYTNAIGFMTATGGTFTLTIGSLGTTAAIAHDASPATIQTTIRAVDATLAAVTVYAPVDGPDWRIENIPAGQGITANTGSLAGGTLTFVASSAQNVMLTSNSVDANGQQGVFTPQVATVIMGNKFTGNSRSANNTYAAIDLNSTIAPTPAGCVVIGNQFMIDASTANRPAYSVRATGGNTTVVLGNYAVEGSSVGGLINSGALLSASFNSLSFPAGLNVNNSQAITGYSDALNLSQTWRINSATGAAGFGVLTSVGRVRGLRTVTAAGAVAVAAANETVVINKTVAAATAVTLPASPATGQVHTIKDGKGDAASSNITISPAAGTIDGAATLVISSNYGKATVSYTGSEWVTI